MDKPQDPVTAAFFDAVLQDDAFKQQQNNVDNTPPAIQNIEPAQPNPAVNTPGVGEPVISGVQATAESTMLPVYGDNVTSTDTNPQPQSPDSNILQDITKTISDIQQGQQGNLTLQQKLIDSLSRNAHEQNGTGQQQDVFDLNIEAPQVASDVLEKSVGGAEVQDGVKSIIASMLNPYLNKIKEKFDQIQTENQSLKAELGRTVQDEVFLNNTYNNVPDLETHIRDPKFQSYLDQPNLAAGGIPNRDIYNTLLSKRDSRALASFIGMYTNNQSHPQNAASNNQSLPSFTQGRNTTPQVTGSLGGSGFPPQYQTPATSSSSLPQMSSNAKGPHVKYSDYLRLSQSFERGAIQSSDFVKAKKHFDDMMLKGQVLFDVQPDAEGRFPRIT